MDYELLDFGGGRRLEKVGEYILIRPDSHAKGSPVLEEGAWVGCDAEFIEDRDGKGEWRLNRAEMPREWVVRCLDLMVGVRLSASKQIGFFPEQEDQWEWIEQKLRNAKRPVRVLSLFGFTGIASLVSARAGAEVVHIDASRPAISLGKENQERSNLQKARIRWICEDCVTFSGREKKRGNKYDAIVLDPPAFGRGPNGEVWQFSRDLELLLKTCCELLNEKPAFFILNAYADSMVQAELERIVEGTVNKKTFNQRLKQELSLGSKSGQKLDSGTTAYLYE